MRETGGKMKGKNADASAFGDRHFEELKEQQGREEEHESFIEEGVCEECRCWG